MMWNSRSIQRAAVHFRRPHNPPCHDFPAAERELCLIVNNQMSEPGRTSIKDCSVGSQDSRWKGASFASLVMVEVSGETGQMHYFLRKAPVTVALCLATQSRGPRAPQRRQWEANSLGSVPPGMLRGSISVSDIAVPSSSNVKMSSHDRLDRGARGYLIHHSSVA